MNSEEKERIVRLLDDPESPNNEPLKAELLDALAEDLEGRQWLIEAETGLEVAIDHEDRPEEEIQ